MGNLFSSGKLVFSNSMKLLTPLFLLLSALVVAFAASSHEDSVLELTALKESVAEESGQLIRGLKKKKKKNKKKKKKKKKKKGNKNKDNNPNDDGKGDDD